ncbi:MAG TPA: hypothetical protein VNO50_10765 [Pyrinomonadaceae bacterium]|nr:hypothetical protein [Pyrinomonadaceae bacterium]
MKGWALLFFLAIALNVQGAHVLFNFHDFTSTTVELTNRRVLITPKSTPRVDSGRIASSDRLSFLTDANASFTVSNMVHGSYYVEVPGPYTVTPFTILVPQTNAFLNATGLLSQTIDPASTAGYTQTQINALLSSNLVYVAAGTNIVAVTNGNVVTISGTASGGGGGSSSESLLTMGTGSPVGTDPGTVFYYDVTAQSLWINIDGESIGWIQLLKTGYPPYEGGIGGGGGSEVLSGNGSPEGAVTANPSTLYWDTTKALYLKQSGTGPTGWIQLLRFSP